MPSSRTNFLLEGISDHCPAKVTLEDDSHRRLKAFQYCNAWGQHPQFQNVVKEGSDMLIMGCKMFQVVRKMKLLKGALKQLNTQHFRNILTEAGEDRKALKIAQLYLQAHPSSTEAQQIEKEIYMKFRQSSYLAEMYLQQQSKVTWLRLGDDNTRYFHVVIKYRRLKQTTTQLKIDQGNWQTDPDTIANIFVFYYKDLLGRKEPHRRKANKYLMQNGNVLTIEHQIKILAPFSEKDVKTAMFSIDINKSPGPDGYGDGFFKSSWNIVEKDITEDCLWFKLARDEVLQWFGITLPSGETKQVMEMIMRRHWKKFKKK
ncbi:hypothetical protein RDI58_022389 [Solanum bulbocastanum]|uniref:Uncharacterized protein n=1 Tax=Solanum bulbocastanum TaxID=147425 RepID=A0AAN8Y565_SOLBU